MAIDFGGGKIPAVRGLQSLVSEIPAGSGGKQFRGGNIAGGIDVELNGYADGAADGGESPGRDAGHDLVEHFALGDGASGRLGSRLNARRISDASESSRRRRGSRGIQRARITGTRISRFARFLRRRLPRSLRRMLRRRWHRTHSWLRGLLRRLGNAFRVCSGGQGLCGGRLLRYHGGDLPDSSAAMEEARTEKNRDESENGEDAERKVIDFRQRRKQRRTLEVGLNKVVARLGGGASGSDGLRMN